MKISNEDKSGLYLTAIIHLAALIILLISQIGTAVKGENSYLLDFSHIEDSERQQQEEEFRESISDRLDRLIAGAGIPDPGQTGEEIRNIAVDANQALSDDRNTDADELYRDVERLARELESGAFAPETEDNDSYATVPDNTGQDKDKGTYNGPSVVSFSLDGRKAMSLSVPAYRCQGGGDVTVRITVSQSGKVTDAEISEEFSSPDKCLREYAIRAARLSIFTASPTAPKKQYGEIVYRFIPQI